ncbi:hypothetical protein [Aeromonas hydrophila]|uniref:hypothetical protein n=1 Tax=Aeromonas hydrophila TaxID=644 RepID=UPI00191D9FD5|nr:hypothetical protein [Aeromonas hydrophila]MBL0559283.1 hypothetical protein [Aeromonas hydrophila]
MSIVNDIASNTRDGIDDYYSLTDTCKPFTVSLAKKYKFNLQQKPLLGSRITPQVRLRRTSEPFNTRNVWVNIRDEINKSHTTEINPFGMQLELESTIGDGIHIESKDMETKPWENNNNYYEAAFFSFFNDISDYEENSIGETLIFKKSSPTISSSSSSYLNINNNNEDYEINKISDLVFTQLSEARYIAGELSIVDYKIEGFLRDKGEGFVLKLMNNLALKCYSSKVDVTYAHFLNVLKNLTFHTNDDSLKTNVLAALGHKSIVIKEAAIAVFEGWHYKSHDEASQVIGLLDNVDTGHVGWLTEYKNMVISDLKEEFEVK